MDAGYEVITVNNGSAALKRVAERKPDIIVLDVYMPGYGGLEVCQRLKENRETSRIPVLLTVGKLEPFKVEEARRVRADMHIIKPFEASELLTALTKLEDKIVPRADAFKPGRFAKAIAEIEQSATEDKFDGDEETGWKNRINFPRAGKKGEEAEGEAAPEAASEKKSLKEMIEAQEAASRKREAAEAAEATTPARLPQDITPEEMAAISSVAASLASDAPSAVQDMPVVDSPAVSEASPSPAAQVSPEPAVSEPELVAQPEEEKGDAAKAEVCESAAPAVPQFNSEEVSSALAQLTTANSDQANASTLAIEPEKATGPRWMAESASLSDAEAQIVLEEEMQKAFGTFSSAEVEPVSFAMAPAGVPEPVYAVSGAVVESGAPIETPAPESVAVGSEEETSGAMTASSAVVENAESKTESRFEAKTEPESSYPSSEPVVVSETQPQEASGTTAPEVAGIGEPPTTPSDAKEVMAVAAAGSAADSFAPATPAESNAVAKIDAEAVRTAVSHATEGIQEADLAAAWQNWKQIRDTAGGKSTSEEGGTAEMAFKDIRRETPVVKEPEVKEEEAAASEDGEASDIASIVDSVLAEMKPKIVQEIAKKMAKKQH
jgi:CheY-like chemotaxis protein